MTPRHVIKKLVPPFLVDAVRALQPRPAPGPPEWEYVPDGWAAKDPKIQGWNVASVLENQKAKWPQFLQSVAASGPLAVSHESANPSVHDYTAHNTLMCYAYVLALAARKKDRLSILDWGGGIGHYYVLSRALLPDVSLDYHVKEVPLLCAGGRKLLPEVHFHEESDTCLQRTYDLVFVSGSMHYEQDWKALAQKFAAAGAPYVYVTRLPTVHQADSFVVVQRPYIHGYHTEYLGWFFNRQAFVLEFENCGMKLAREFLIQERPQVHNAPEQGEYRGFLFRSTRHSEMS